jgi:hypothetical protein
MTTHWFWLALMVACLLWYSIITLYVAVKGAKDIRTMLQALERDQQDDHGNR